MKGVIIVLLVSCLAHFTQSLQSHPVTTFLNTKWSVAPICLEIAEYLFDENRVLYWDYAEQLLNAKTPLYQIDNDQKLYTASLKPAESLIGPVNLPLLKLSLSMHSLLPRVQAHFQIASEITNHGNCGTNTFVTIGSKVACDLKELKAGIEKAEKDTEEIYSFDHVYPGSENNTITTILYSQIGAEEWGQFHEYLKNLAVMGKVKYVSRHYIRNLPKNKARLSGYGVELHLKSTEYKSQDDAPRTDEKMQNSNDTITEIEGFDFKRLKERFPSLSHSLDQFRATLLTKSEEIAPLKAWEFQELGLQAVHRIASIQGEEALQILEFISQNFPNQAKSLLNEEVPESLRKEMKHNMEVLGENLNIRPPDASLFVNGLYFDSETLDVGTLLETLRSEYRVLNGLYNLNIKGKTASDLLALDLSSKNSKEFAIDIRDSAVTWINDLENDSQYKRWPSSVMDLLRPTFPGMMRTVRKNLFNMVLLFDPIKPKARDLIKLAESFVIHNAPLRLGLVFDSRSSDKKQENVYRAILCAFNYVTQQRSPRQALGFLTDNFAATKPTEDITIQTIQNQLKKSFTDLSSGQIDDIIGEDSDFDYGRQVSTEFLDRLGFKDSPQALLNGAPLQQRLLNTDEFEEAILSEIMQQTSVLQKAVFNGDLSDSVNVVDYLMNLPHIMPRLNQRILSTEAPTFLDVSGTPHNDLRNVKALAELSTRDMTATLMANIKYFYSKRKPEKILGTPVVFLTIWIVGDLETKNGRETLKNALEHMKTTGAIRVGFIPNIEGLSANKRTNLNRLVWAATQTLNGVDATNTVLKWLSAPEKAADNIPAKVKDLLSETELHMKMLRVYCNRVLNLRASQVEIIANGIMIGPLDDDEQFIGDDFNLIERFINHQYGDQIRKVVQNDENFYIDMTSDIIVKLIALLVPREQSRRRFVIPSEIEDDFTAVKLIQKIRDAPYFDIFAVLDPASREAQKLSSILILLRNVVNCNMRVLLCAVDKHSDMPVKNFYRFVIEPEIKFTADGRYASGPDAKFFGLPSTSLLTQNLQVPENWMVEVVRSVYDLDNIKLSDINGPVHSEYELEYLLLEGHCFDMVTGAPPRGLQFTLGTRDKPIIVDTIVMANLGYFQLKANPGAWILKLRHGKSDEIYSVSSVEGSNVVHGADGTRVIISSLRSHVLKMRVSKKPGHATSDLLGDDDDVQTGIWDSITSSFGGGTTDTQDTETINIFSVASGHLYERLLRIMMLSLMKHTKSPVKFWFLKNYLSPQFIDFLPHMAKEYGFHYELVQYKWPRWLQQQTEKQRTIWGYKILFFDVLFPLDVKKIIFVDADAIVRADIKELNMLDLNGAPYAYTPFCDSRRDMEGFRFWKQGYWRNHLQGRKYHISALYVVDLKRFRRIAAGDRLRGQYQALSQDPNSLSNLDQDLPNNMIHQVAIKSLPQEWLWCQTWCNDETLPSAKVIDLCNNPMTKEAKLTAAQRIVPEWKDYDSEIKKLMNRVEDNEMGLDEHHSTIETTGTGGNTIGGEDKKLRQQNENQDIHSEL